MQTNELFETVSSRHGQLTFFANDTGALATSLRKYGEWAENELQFMLSAIPVGSTIIDVGAYVGTHAMAFSRHTGGAGRVVAIEAQRRSADVLARNIRDNAIDNVQLENAVICAASNGDVVSSIDIAAPASYGSTSLVDVMAARKNKQAPESHEPSGEELAVRSIALDDLSVQSCELVKIDVEGMEDAVVRGAERLLREHRPIVYAECNSLEKGLKTWAALAEFGYRVRAHVVLAFNPQNFRGDPENVFGVAREVALVGTSTAKADPFDAYACRPCELLLDIDTVDDLALALLNKPQYEQEVLRQSAAARSGGTLCLDELGALRGVRQKLTDTFDTLRAEVGRYFDASHELDEQFGRSVTAICDNFRT
ncbi:hypothetical protein WJ47_08770 [Burkholderia ubonensis]|uniref:Methyltransferase FkbM domain-containing protein n=1 Tax=Burkholderia ubonensis TaxID=101571 RepID=A0AB73FYS7_9BURK|nr:FkbM family methyltransferase [Burkholderia ubonensis]KVD26046.1 hypothetical protein WI82_16415 [Burkholderia ubonensis]KVK73912.1 hypothetical protein WJ44_18395 [Burkholderia ubonensis]KVL69772.1 hypothetical protein WJ47_08770 [Burkholderia ubonensis]KVM27070.1 hypothetical protein WJ53_11430 [Burkholderia ubonensis]KVM42706.1 hypothetical protein WJ54_26135 [Burkholderia ubonensis]